ncbi:MAG: alpha/beta hydrolase, partial [Clostridia bacterium]|nr:alpha/beta hydrolase [Clostridia bacterium]
MAYFIHDGQQLHYEFLGDPDFTMRPPVLMLHGNGEDMHCFDRAIAPLLNSQGFFLLDSRLHGESRPLEDGSRRLSYSTMADDAIALMEHLGIREYDVVGYSDGGIVALIMAMRSIFVRRIITLGANTDPSGLTFRARFMISRAYKKALSEGDERTAELQRLMLEEPHITLGDLASIVAEATVVLGSKDAYISKKHSVQIA